MNDKDRRYRTKGSLSKKRRKDLEREADDVLRIKRNPAALFMEKRKTPDNIKDKVRS